MGEVSWLADPVHFKMLLAACLGTFIGLEREISGKDPSVRTFALISMGSCLFTILSLEAASTAQGGDPARIAAQIIPGIGFIGAGTIFRSKKGVSGFTTAALMWIAASIGMAVGIGRHELAVNATLVAIALTATLRLFHIGIGKLKGDKDNEILDEE
jgi:putative Mg2+ transporter-C (MgtC) family protein